MKLINTIKAHKEDGLALTKFIYWIKNINKKKITEIEAKNKLEKFRKLNNELSYFQVLILLLVLEANGAIVHYRVSKKVK